MQGTVDTRIPYLTSLSYLQTQNLNQENAKSQEALKTSIEHISTGLRVIDASDDLAGFAIADRFDVQVQGMTKALQNTNEALSAARIAEGSLHEYTDILGYMKELAEKAANENTTNNERMTLQEQIDNLQERLKSISNETTFRGRKLLDGTYRTQDIQVGNSLEQILSVSLKTARPDQIGLHEVVSEGTMNNAGSKIGFFYEMISTGVTASDSMTIQGFLGAESISIEDDSSAKNIADLINESSDSTGVEASAKSYAKLYDLSEAGTISFKIHGSTDVSISATITSPGDLSPLYNELESAMAATHITPELSADGSSIHLFGYEGHNIGIESFSHSTFGGNINFIGLQFDGDSTTGTGVILNDFINSTMVGGYVEFQSDEPFILFAGTGGALFTTASSTHLPTLQAVDDIDLSTQAGAEDALTILDHANVYVEKIRSDVQAYESGFESIIARLESASEQMEDSKHRVVSANLAEETMKASSATIQIQSQSALVTQANRLIPEYSLFLLRQ
jgi:flagellin